MSSAAQSRFLEPLEAALVIVAAGILAYQLFVPPCVGLADDGDFWKVMTPAGVQYRTSEPKPHAYWYLTLRYRVAPPLPSGYYSSETPIVAAVRFTEERVRRDTLFDIRTLGLLHSAIFLAGFALLLAGTRPLAFGARLAFGAALLFFFTDVGYVATLNSMYSATASLLFLLVAAGAAASLAGGIGGRGPWIAYGVGALGFVTSKPQESAQAAVLGALAVFLAWKRRTIPLRGPMVLAAVLCFGAFVYYEKTPIYLKSEALYNDLFLQLLFQSETPKADLRELGLPEEWIAYYGTYAYAPNSALPHPGFRAELLKRFGYRRIARFYARHPARAVRMLALAARSAFSLRPPYLGNFPVEAGQPPGARSRACAAWSAAKKKLSALGPLILPIFWLSNIGAWVGVLRRRGSDAAKRGYALALLALVAMSLVEFATCTFGDALADVARHLHSFNAMTDLLLAADLALLAGFALRRRAKASPLAATSP